MKFRVVSLLLFIFTLSFVNAQKTGKEVFDENQCKSCHMLTDMRLVGPGFQGILERRDRAWLKKWITNSTELIASGDEQAVAIFEEYNKVPMLSYELPEEELEALIDYIGGVEVEKVEEAVKIEKEVVENTNEANKEVLDNETIEESKAKEKSALSKAFEGRPLLQSFFWAVLLILIAALIAVLNSYFNTKK